MGVGYGFLRTRAALRPAFYLIAGATNTVFGYALYAVLLMLHVPPLAAIVMATIGGTLFNFRTIGAVFGSRDIRLLPRFVAVYAACLCLNLLIAHVLIGLGLSPFLVQAVCLAVLAPCCFLAMQCFVFPSVPQEIRQP
jgi:putative flippase GtrA